MTEEVKWANSPAKAYLLDLLRNDKIPQEMKPKKVFETYCKDIQEFLPFGDKNFASRLRTLRNKIVSDQRKGSATNKVKWINSPAKAYLLNLLRNNEIPRDMNAREVFDTYCKHRQEFLPFGDAYFGSRLKSLRDKVDDQNNKAARDAAALLRDRTIYPRPIMDGFGLPYWPDSEAKELLTKDVKEAKHKTMSKEQLFLSRPEYAESIPYHFFVKRVHQEEKTQKFHAYVEDKRSNKIAKKHMENMPFAK